MKSLYDHSFDGDIDFAALSVITDILSKGIILSHWADAHTIDDKTSVIAAPIEINNERHYAVLISGKKKSEFKYPYVMRVFSDAYIKDELLNIYRTSPQGVTTSRQNADFQKFAANLLINYILNNSDLSFLTTNSANTQNNDNNQQPINCNRNMNVNRINEIGNTVKGQEMLGRTAERAYQRANRTSGADKNRYMKTYNDAYRTGGKSANKHLGGSREHFDNGRDYEHEKWADEHNGNVTESKTMNRKLIRLTESDLHKIVKESVNKILRETVDANRMYVEQFLKKHGLYNSPLEWMSNNCFCDSHGCNGYIFDSENDATNSVLYGEDHQNAIDSVDGAQSDREWINYLIKGGVEPQLAKSIILNQEWDKVVEIIVSKDGPEWFLSDYSGQVYTLPNGKLLYY